MPDARRPRSDRSVTIPVPGASLEGRLTLPTGVSGVVVFAHGSGSSRLSPRNLQVAEQLQRAGLGTLLFDLLTEAEARSRANVFDIPLLAGRLLAAVRWVRSTPEVRDLPVGLFGASTGGGAALVAAGQAPDEIRAVVSRGGRPDLAGEWLPRVRAPTLLVVGGDDHAVLGLNRDALARVTADKRLTVIPGATHLFEEPGALDAAAREAADWFVRHFTAPDT